MSNEITAPITIIQNIITAPLTSGGLPGTGLPTGGTVGQIPVKQSSAANDIAWEIPFVNSEVEFDNTDLNTGILSVAHNKGFKRVKIFMWDNNDIELDIMSAVTLVDTNNLTVDLAILGAISGTWIYRVI